MDLYERSEEEIKEIEEKILKTIFITKAKRIKSKQRKKLKTGEIRTYIRTDYFVRLPSAMGEKRNKKIAILTWEGFEDLLTIKMIYNLSDNELTWILLDILAHEKRKI
ncbi:MAG: hypothetical protein N2V75_03915 [Methanophagales archaeon]|nr:hypothetical protein [Methanophagales archaeon]